ncbi:MAG: hypothetical protein Q9174_003894 [Haloplaca sp. 1 TL-2023]
MATLDEWFVEQAQPTEAVVYRATLHAARVSSVKSMKTNKLTFMVGQAKFSTLGAFEKLSPAEFDLKGPCEGTFRSSNVSRPGCSPERIIRDSDYEYGAKPPEPSLESRNMTLEDLRYNDNPENYGHIPLALLDWMLKDPLYTVQFPGLASCRPGGPEIKAPNICFTTVGAEALAPVPALTVGTENVVYGAGCFRPGACSIISTSNNQGRTPVTASAQVTADPLQVGDSSMNTLNEMSTTSQNGAAFNVPITTRLPIRTTAGKPSEPSRESSGDKAATSMEQIQISKGIPQEATPAADPQEIDVGSITATPSPDSPNVIGSRTPAPGSSTIGFDDSTYFNPIVTRPISKGSPLLLGQATLSSESILSSSTDPPLAQEGNASPAAQVSSNPKPSPVSGAPVGTLLDEQTAASLNGLATAESQPQSADVSSSSGTSSLNDDTTDPGDRANGNWQANIASFIMNGFGYPVGSSFSAGASPEAGTQPSPSAINSSIVTLNSAEPIEPTSLLNHDAVNEALSLQSSSLIEAGSVARPIIIAGSTIPVGASVTISGTTYALPSSGTSILVNGSPSPLPPSSDPAQLEPSTPDDAALALIEAAGYSVVPAAPGTIISGTTYSRPATGTEVFINGSPSLIPLNIPDIPGSGTRMQNTSPPSSFSLSQTAEIQSALVIASRTLQPGQAITVSGNIISLPSTGTDAIIVDGQVQTFTPVKPSGSSGVNDAVFTVANKSIGADFIKASTATSADNRVGTRINGEGRAEAVTATESDGEGVQTGSSTSGGSPSIVAFEGSGTESLGVRNRRNASSLNAWISVLSVLLAWPYH